MPSGNLRLGRGAFAACVSGISRVELGDFDIVDFLSNQWGVLVQRFVVEVVATRTFSTMTPGRYAA